MDLTWVHEVSSNAVSLLTDHMVDLIYYLSDRNIFTVIFMKHGNVLSLHVNEN